MAQGNEFHSSGNIGADSSFTAAFAEVYDDEVYPVGSLRLESADSVVAGSTNHSGDRLWVFVKASAAGALTANSVVKRDTGASGALPAYTGAVAGAAATNHLLLGVAQTAIPAGKYGWIVKRGACVCTSGGGITKGLHLMTAASGKVDDITLDASVAAHGSMIIGQALTATVGADTAVDAYISIP